MPQNFIERLKQSPVLCDGAMGTLLYAKGIFINRCYDELNLSQPELIRGVHHDYLQAGAEIVETNTFGAMAMTQAVLPQFRARRSGVVVNVTSSVTLTPMPLAAVYTGSKMAIEGFTGSLALELEAFNVHVKHVEPASARPRQ